ncbi:protein PXR1 [Apodospora peruviana]|uniref:PinX1-related protein 1 n=1 Tax=Apodospora peruviana TaxID=516989 RepID=A0AAE0MEN5_9PEZI|nr:protein PXR1 [Apodospora peruviana]
MGLAGAKNKRKLGVDPNNTKWSRNTDSFGQKLLRAQGWEPGQYLGAKDAAHAEWHTEANSSHIQVVLKDDMLGLGAKRNTGDECTGLDAFQVLLGRLNGKTEDTLESERQKREEVKLSHYIERKLGTIRFVKGGWLVGDQVKEKLAEEEDGTPKNDSTPEAATVLSEDSDKSSDSAEKKSKKREADRGEKPSKRGKNSKKRKTEIEADSDSEDSRAKLKSKMSKKRKMDGDASEAVPSATPASVGSDSEVESKKARKEKKKREKEEKRERKEKRRKEKTESDDSISREKKRRKGGDESVDLSEPAASSVPASGVSTPSGSGYSTPNAGVSSRYLSRQRFIAQKRMAFTDATAMNQIFMIKS